MSEIEKAVIESLSKKYLRVSLLYLVFGAAVIAFCVNRVAQWERQQRDMADSISVFAHQAWLIVDEREYVHQLQELHPEFTLPNPVEVTKLRAAKLEEPRRKSDNENQTLIDARAIGNTLLPD
jgi:hypothetical protein